MLARRWLTTLRCPDTALPGFGLLLQRQKSRRDNRARLTWQLALAQIGRRLLADCEIVQPSRPRYFRMARAMRAAPDSARRDQKRRHTPRRSQEAQGISLPEARPRDNSLLATKRWLRKGVRISRRLRL